MLSFQSFVTDFALADISGEGRRKIRWHVAILLKVTQLRKWIVHLWLAVTARRKCHLITAVSAMEPYSFLSVLDNKRKCCFLSSCGKTVLAAADT